MYIYVNLQFLEPENFVELEPHFVGLRVEHPITS